LLLPREEGHSRRPGIKERRYDGKEKDGKDEEEFELNWRKNCWDHRQDVCSSLPHTRYRVKNVLLYVLRYYLLTINYGSSSFHVMIWEPSSVLWSFFRWAMSDLREGQRRLHSEILM
jgi:hypothetical protein